MSECLKPFAEKNFAFIHITDQEPWNSIHKEGSKVFYEKTNQNEEICLYYFKGIGLTTLEKSIESLKACIKWGWGADTNLIPWVDHGEKIVYRYKKFVKYLYQTNFLIRLALKVIIYATQKIITFYDQAMSIYESKLKVSVTLQNDNVLVSNRKHLRRNTMLIIKDIICEEKFNFPDAKFLFTTSSAIFLPKSLNSWLQILSDKHNFFYAKRIKYNKGLGISGFAIVFTIKGREWLKSKKYIDGSINNDVWLTKQILKYSLQVGDIDYKVLGTNSQICLFCDQPEILFKVENKRDRYFEIELINDISRTLCETHSKV